jgi:monoterpene epsilon-lactone hydrolase
VTDVETRAWPPVPDSISEQARSFLTSPSPFGGDSAPFDPDDTPAWEKFIAERDTAIAQVIRDRLPGDLPVEESSFEIDGTTTYVIRPRHVDGGAATPVYLDIHGGALILGGGEVCRLMSRAMALGRPMITWSVDYRMPPNYPYPASLDDCCAVYRRLLEERSPQDIFVGGASAGGNLAAALMLRAKDEGLAMPVGLVLRTPEVDLTESGDTFHTLNGIDNALQPLMRTNLLYANGADLADPYLSPLFGDLSGFPPTFLQAGTRDLFLSNTVRMHRRLLAAGVEAELHVFEAMPHGGFGGGTPEDMDLAQSVLSFLERRHQLGESLHAKQLRAYDT